MQLQIIMLRNFLDLCLREDYGIGGDITTNAILDKDMEVNFSINGREPLIICGIQIAEYYLNTYSSVKYKTLIKDGDFISSGMKILSGIGSAKEILLLERVILNFLQHMSGISTLTNQYVQKIKSTNTKICDTRKTTPGLRNLQKYAVFCGGGYNHRLTLDSSILIKDNHIAICGGVRQAIKRAKIKHPHYTKIEIECDTLEQVKEAVNEGVDIIMLDNMVTSEISEAIKIIDNKAIVEASGGVNFKTIEEIARTGVDLISIGKLTTGAVAVDIGLDINGEY